MGLGTRKSTFLFQKNKARNEDNYNIIIFKRQNFKNTFLGFVLFIFISGRERENKVLLIKRGT